MSQAYPHLYPVIICDDMSPTLWPLSRTTMPRELVTLAPDTQSLLSFAVAQTAALVSTKIHVVCAPGLAQTVRDHLLGQMVISEDRLKILTLPVQRGTAFSVALAAAYIKQQDSNAVMLALRAGMRFVPDERWDAAIKRAYRSAMEDYIAVIGVKPTRTGSDHSYIRIGSQIPGILGVHKAQQFVETSGSATATRMPGLNCLWNTGIFMARSQVILGEYYRASEQTKPSAPARASRIVDTVSFLISLGGDSWDNDDARQVVASLPNVSFEHAVLEGSEKVAVVDSSLEWQDISSLVELDELGVEDADKNRSIATRFVPISTSDTTVYAKEKMVATLGLRNMLVVDTPDALLVANKDALHAMGTLTDVLRELHVSEYERTTCSWYAWGSSVILERDDTYDVCRVSIGSQASMPLESCGRARETWTVLSGHGILNTEGKSQPIKFGSSFILEPKTLRGFKASGTEPLVMLVVASRL
ncbi:MAG: hypothetical protein HGA54_06750 [Actinobacteria bacterium]|nr:hypothetical protein [Actinomycetota bacterium]